MMLINSLGFLLIAGIVWWFWIYKPDGHASTDSSKLIIVENGVYTPSRISVPAGEEASISFMRKDASPCSGTLVFTDLDISEDLAVGKVKKILLPKLEPGKYVFGCQMQMYRGELLVI
jgi:plastocyanin domain-containing protein